MGRKIIKNPNHCPLIHAMNAIGGKWKPIIIHVLENKELRFGKLLFLLDPISRKVLTEQLRELENDGLILREKYAETPPRVDYSLTEKGQELVPIIDQLAAWSDKNIQELSFEDI